MTKLLLQLAFLPLVLGTVHADESRDDRNANMLWSDNEEFHRVNTPHLVNWNMYMYRYMSWSDNEEFHRMDATHVDPDLVNSNMSWSDNKEFQKF